MAKFPMPCCADCKYVTLAEDKYTLGCEQGLDNYRVNISDCIDMNMTAEDFQEIAESIVCESFQSTSLAGIAGPGADQERHKLEAIQHVFIRHLDELVDDGILKEKSSAPRQRG